MEKMKLKKGIGLAVMVLALIAAAVPMIGARVSAAGSSAEARRAEAALKNASAITGPITPIAQPAQETSAAQVTQGEHKVSTRKYYGLSEVAKGFSSQEIGRQIANRIAQGKVGHKNQGGVTPSAGEPVNMNAAAAFSAAIITSEGG